MITPIQALVTLNPAFPWLVALVTLNPAFPWLGLVEGFTTHNAMAIFIFACLKVMTCLGRCSVHVIVFLS